MATYDSDSSDGEDGDYTKTSTLLGYAEKDPTDDSISQLGGYPTWLDNATSPSGTLAKCKVCNNFLTLLLQLDANNLQTFPGHERRLYLFACRRKTCRRKEGSIRGIRGNRVTKSPSKPAAQPPPTKEPEPEPAAPPQNIGAQLFGGSTLSNGATNPFASTRPTNPFSSSGTSNPLATSNPFASASSLAAKPAQKPEPSIATLPETFASKARISDSSSSVDPSFKPSISEPIPHEPWPSTSELPKPYPSYHLDAGYEELDAPSTPAVPNIGPGIEDAEMSGTGAGMEKLFESSMDKTFQKFADRLSQNPEQVLRYELSGTPLLYSTTDAVGKLLSPPSGAGKVTTTSGGASRIPRCTNCGANRIFEVQLTPHAITVLEEEELSLEGMDWGTIIMGVCSKDCSPRDVKDGHVGYLEEWVGVQWEELEKRRS
ncbi:hypothetical protein FKW77_001648 [Venturia effusa]|uniref:Programmed cell death protein 2 C-terminal domain-containing protein n=1 Tax=Venturia effusa TaxID=50376 RepID=A0A517LQP3_9PEZI|nr:hypothetical protein FKW77_001648 [Venturia effusa]